MLLGRKVLQTNYRWRKGSSWQFSSRWILQKSSLRNLKFVKVQLQNGQEDDWGGGKQVNPGWSNMWRWSHLSLDVKGKMVRNRLSNYWNQVLFLTWMKIQIDLNLFPPLPKEEGQLAKDCWKHTVFVGSRYLFYFGVQNRTWEQKDKENV